MRLRCARCGCYLSAEWTSIANLGGYYIPVLVNNSKVEPCKRCLEEVRRQARPVSLLVRALRGV